MLGFLLQAGVMYLLFNNFMSSKSGGKPAQSAEGSGDVAAAAVTPTPTVSAAPNFLTDMLSGKMFKPAADPELAHVEAARTAALAALPPNARLTNAWEPGMPFSVAVFLATSPALLDDVSALRRLQRGWGDGVPGASATPLTLGKLLSSSSNLYDIAAPVPGVVYPNATFHDVVQCRAVAAPSQAHAPSSDHEFRGASTPVTCLRDDDAVAAGPPEPLWWVGGLTYTAPAGFGGSGDPNYRTQVRSGARAVLPCHQPDSGWDTGA